MKCTNRPACACDFCHAARTEPSEEQDRLTLGYIESFNSSLHAFWVAGQRLDAVLTPEEWRAAVREFRKVN
jgi:hypothetical protein